MGCQGFPALRADRNQQRSLSWAGYSAQPRPVGGEANFFFFKDLDFLENRLESTKNDPEEGEKKTPKKPAKKKFQKPSNSQGTTGAD